MSDMRLIDADKIDFNEVFIGASEFAQDTRNAAQMLIDNQPTAFDVNLIVKKLEEEKTIAYDDSIDEKIRVRLWNKAIGNAIKIVEEGIKNEQ